MKNYLQRVKEFRNAMGLKQTDQALHDKLFREEKSELADAMADMLFIKAGECIDMGKLDELERFILTLEAKALLFHINLWGAFSIVYNSNMSKLCASDEIAATTEKYAALGVDVEYREVSDDLYAAYSATDHPDYPRGKLLKSISYQEPDWANGGWEL